MTQLNDDYTSKTEARFARMNAAWDVVRRDKRAFEPEFIDRMLAGPETGVLPSIQEIATVLGPEDSDCPFYTFDGETFDFPELKSITLRGWIGWGVPGQETIDAIIEAAAGRPILELGCGSGFWAATLKARGLDVVAVDDNSWSADSWWHRTWCDIERMDAAEALRAYPDHVVLTVWPDRKLADVLAKEVEIGRMLLTVAPRYCSGSPMLFQAMDQDFDMRGKIPVPGNMMVVHSGRVLHRERISPDLAPCPSQDLNDMLDLHRADEEPIEPFSNVASFQAPRR